MSAALGHRERCPANATTWKTADGRPICICGVDADRATDFGQALDALRAGKKVQRAGWNGKGMWVVLQKAYPQGIQINRNTSEATGLPEGTVCRFLPYLMFRTAQGDFVPWLASQTDVLGEDWSVVP